MGKASSNKKVARAASTSGGRTAGGRTPWLYYVAIVAIAILGTAMVYVSRDDHLAKTNAQGQGSPPVVNVDHWHEGYAIYTCTSPTEGKFLPPFPYQTDSQGILTLGNGVIDIHPYKKSAAGKNAVLGVFTTNVHVTLNAGELKIPSYPGNPGHTYHDADSCDGKPGRVQVVTFASATTKVGTQWTKDPSTVPLADLSMVVIAFMPKGATIPPPPASVITALQHPIDEPQALPPSTTTTTVPGATTTTVPGATTTTVAGATTTVPTTTAPTTTLAPATSTTVK
jgi:hypothetical protein